MTAIFAPARPSPAMQVQTGMETASISKDRLAARKAAEEFEQTFLVTMLGAMFEGVKTSAPYGGGHAEQQFRSVLLDEYAKDMARNGGIGIADEVYREILAIQEGKM